MRVGGRGLGYLGVGGVATKGLEVPGGGREGLGS